MHEAWAREVVEFVGDESGAVRAVLVEEVEIVRVDGRREFRPVPARAAELPADLVLLAAGFVGTDVPELLDALGVARRPGARHDRRRRPLADLDAGCYACGDATRGASLVVWAIAEGRACAAAVDHVLTGADRSCPQPVRARTPALCRYAREQPRRLHADRR